MCGFVGFVGGTDNQSEVLTKMMDRIVHRGPDMGGQFIDALPSASAACRSST